MEIIEQELKYQLSKENFYKLQRYLNNNGIKCNSTIQTNYYIDNDEFILNKNNITIRIREILGGKCEFTLKIPIKNNYGIECAAIKKEITIEINNVVANDLLDNMIWDKDLISILYKNIELPIDFSKLDIIGSLTTERILYKFKNINEPISIDKSTYFDTEDYEVEWETTELDKYNDMLLNIFNTIGIECFNNNSSKNDRFIKRLKSI